MIWLLSPVLKYTILQKKSQKSVTNSEKLRFISESKTESRVKQTGRKRTGGKADGTKRVETGL